MHIVLISECARRSVSKTQRILDSYAIRAGIRTWITPITSEGLAELHAALRKTATRNTAVACYQNDGRRRMRLLWVVGARGKFSANGAVAVRKSRCSCPQKVETPVWLRCVCLLAQSAAQVHDLGKYSKYFQQKLRSPQSHRDDVRHEWISVCVLRELRQGKTWQDAWQVLQNPEALKRAINRPASYRTSFAPATALEAIEFLVASHHRLFAGDMGNGRVPSVRDSHVRSEAVPQEYCQPHEALPDDVWKNYQRLESKLENLAGAYQGEQYTSFWWACLTLARAALIFADHTVSAVEYSARLNEGASAANTRFAGEMRQLNQPLPWHLHTVAHVAASAAWRMGQLAQGKGSILEGLQEASVASILDPADETSRFHWQNCAADALSRWRQKNPDTPCLVFNMAGTGSGKTRMNLRAACILSRQDAPRCSIALNLRSLTLQTGRSLQEDLGILPADMATVIGDGVTQRLFDWNRQATSADDWDADEPEIICSGDSGPLPAWMEPFWRTDREKTVVGAPLLVSTIDFLDAAGCPQRQGHHVKALLRLMTADLVLDEIDSYDPEALVAVLRLVQLGAFFGRNVVCSSATLSQSTAEAVHSAWVSGQQLRQHLLQQSGGAPQFGIGFIDDSLAPKVLASAPDSAAFAREYACRMQDMTARLQQSPCLRRAFLQPVEPTIQGFQNAVLNAALRLHQENAWNFSPDKRISFGLVRMAHINDAVATARSLAQSLPHAHVACYHAGDWRISRFHKERRLDYLLTRKQGNSHILSDKEIRALVARVADSQDVLFIVVATPVEEVGRDHDFDWAVIEPSSAQSIVQVAGRVNRHRLISCGSSTAHNVAILQYNLKHCKNCEQGKPDLPAFVDPGYEKKGAATTYAKHDLARLLPWQGEELGIDARLRLGGGSRFASADDKAIAERVTPYFGVDRDGNEGLFNQTPVDAFRMASTPYEQTPLRDRNGHKQLWRMQLEDGNWTYFEWQLDAHSASWVCNEHEMSTEKALPNAWLALDPPAMENLCHEAGISPAEGLQAELTAYENTAFIYNLGFGIRREN